MRGGVCGLDHIFGVNAPDRHAFLGHELGHFRHAVIDGQLRNGKRLLRRS
jgi:hypothetical protein